jgi:hypothetical protein
MVNKSVFLSHQGGESLLIRTIPPLLMGGAGGGGGKRQQVFQIFLCVLCVFVLKMYETEIRTT